MENTLLVRFDGSEILDRAVKDIFKRVAGLDVTRVYAHPMDMASPFSLVVTTHGDYDISLVMSTSNQVLHRMTEHMKHGAVPVDGDIPVYTGEFFNILCGHIISALNKQHHCSARFSTPKFIKGHYMTVQKERQLARYCYECEYGIIKIETLLFI